MYKYFKRVFIITLLLINFLSPIQIYANECRYCDFSKIYVGEDKFENFNRKMFCLNSKLNKYIARPAHILWASIMPKYGMDRILSVYNNIEYPKRLASCIIQKDFRAAKNETKRFLTNTTIGLGGLYDPAKKIFNLKQVSENMDQALGKCNMKSGCYLVLPILSSSSPRSLLARLIEAALDPSVYFGLPITALIKFGFVVNKTSYMQPVIKMVESTFADPYDIAKKIYGMENYIKSTNLDRKDLLSTDAKILFTKSDITGEDIIANVQTQDELENLKTKLDTIYQDENILSGLDELTGTTKVNPDFTLKPDIILTSYNAQSPVVDSMRTALFDNPDINKSIWNELSIWNNCFANKIKTDEVQIYEDRDNYKFKYILQKDKNSPLAIIYPSIGEGINSSHSVVFAKMFYDEGYSVVIQGSHFQWEFVKSMEKNYCPGMPAKDANYLKLVTAKIIKKLETEHKRTFTNNLLIGTSFGAMETLHLANLENKNNTLNISKFIAISPPIELIYAMQQADKNSEELNISTEETKHKTAMTAAKIIQITELKKEKGKEINELPFTEQEGKLIVSFLMRQKLSDLIYTINNINKNKKSDFYESMNNISFQDYVNKYLLKESGTTIDEVAYDTSLYSISDYLKSANNYKIYHSLDDFFTNKSQIKQLKSYSPQNVVCLNNGSHLGFLYRKEFLEELKKDIKFKGG